jgi:ABC-type transporter Mla subunit MlaD
VTEDLKVMARDVREASETVGSLSAQIEREAAAAMARMAEVRAAVARSLETALDHAERATAAEGGGDPARLLERVREMIRDAAAKGERLSSASERASRAAARLQRRVEGEAETAGNLTSSLKPAADTEGPALPGTLRVVERDEAAAGDEAEPSERRPERKEGA